MVGGGLLPLTDAAREKLFQLFHFGVGDVDDVGIGPVIYRVILMVAFGGVELIQRDDLSDDGFSKNVGCV